MTLTTIDNLSKVVAFSGDEDDTMTDEPGEDEKGLGLEDDDPKKKSDEEGEESEESEDELVDDDEEDEKDEEEGTEE